MPPRKVSGGRQATLSFNHRVTKASVPKQSAKEAALLSSKVEKEVPGVKNEGIENKDKKEEEKATVRRKAPEDQKGEDAEDTEQTSAPVARATARTRSPTEIEADAVTDSQIRRYWQSVEAKNMARPVHQEGMGLGEKVLRYFDVSSHFGPCVGITRKKRWLRAQRLGLKPPIEVLAVLLQEERKGVEDVQRSSFDTILNAVVAA